MTIEILTVEAAAAELEMSVPKLAMLCKAGWLGPSGRGDAPVITRQAVHLYLELRAVATRGATNRAEADAEMGIYWPWDDDK